MSDRASKEQEEFSLSALAEQVSDLREFVEQQGRRDEIQQQAFDALYEELRQYKDDFIFQMEKPLLLDLLLFYDSLNWFQQSLVKQEMSPEVIADSFQYLIDEFLELLYRRDTLPMDSKSTFDRETQKAIKVIYTRDRSKDYKVRQVLKRGFTRAGRILRPEEVVITRYAPDADDGDGPDQT
ncbi:MAG: nucleotide exchange factor GrpE [Deltaproteobacteria bacterium]|nr:MAG: nucleotide exchange factor GrpE [Deltaproteobacteria bacterium]